MVRRELQKSNIHVSAAIA